MEIKQINTILKKYKLPISCARFFIIYWLFLFIATHSSVFKTGLAPRNWFSIIIIGCLVSYRFFSFCIGPALLFIWIVELFRNKNQ